MERNEKAKKAFRSIYTFTLSEEADFSRVAEQSRRGSTYLDSLYDGMLLYASAINKSFEGEYKGTPKGYDVVQNMIKTTSFEGLFREIEL